MSEQAYIPFHDVTIGQLNRWVEQGIKITILWDKEMVRVPTVEGLKLAGTIARTGELP